MANTIKAVMSRADNIFGVSPSLDLIVERYSVLKEKFTLGKENASLSLVLSLHPFLLWSAVLCADHLHCSTGECGGWLMSFSFPFSI